MWKMFSLLLAAIWQLIRNPGLVESRWICLVIFLLFISETSQYPSCLCLEEITLFVRLDGKHPSSGYVIPRIDFPQINKIENCIVNQGFVLQVFCFSKLFVISSYFFSWGFFSCAGSLFGFISCCPSVGCPTLFQHISSLTINFFWYVNLKITEVISHLMEVQWSLNTRHSGQIAPVLLISISCRTKKKLSGSCGMLVCFRRHCPMFIIGWKIPIWTRDCSSWVLTLCTALIAKLTVFITRICTCTWSLQTCCWSL